MGDYVVGVSVSLGGLDLRLIIAGDPSAWLQKKEFAYRPKYINFYQGNEVYSIATAWMAGKDEAIWISRGDSIAPLPEN